MQKVVTDINGNKYLRQWKPGPKPRGYVKVLVNIPAEYLELMKWKNEECDRKYIGIPLELLTPSNTGLQTDMCQVCYTEFIPIGKVESWKYCPVCGTRR